MTDAGKHRVPWKATGGSAGVVPEGVAFWEYMPFAEIGWIWGWDFSLSGPARDGLAGAPAPAHTCRNTA